MTAFFERFTLNITKSQAKTGSHQGQCDADISYLLIHPAIRRQLDKIPPDDIRANLKEYGAWDTEDLADDAANRARIIWIACGNVLEELRTKERGAL